MTREEYSVFIAKVAPENARYILRCEEIIEGFERAERYRKDGKLEKYGVYYEQGDAWNFTCYYA